MDISHQNLKARSDRNEENLLVSFRTHARCLIKLGAINIRTIAEGSISFSHRPSSSLVQKVPVKTCEGPMLLTLVLQKQRTLLRSKFLQIPEIYKEHPKVDVDSDTGGYDEDVAFIILSN